jgi:hypothetical protein
MDLVTHTSAPCAPTGAPPSRATLRWVAECLGQGAEVRMVRPLAGGAAHANHALLVESPSGSAHRLVLRRWTPRDPVPQGPYAGHLGAKASRTPRGTAGGHGIAARTGGLPGTDLAFTDLSRTDPSRAGLPRAGLPPAGLPPASGLPGTRGPGQDARVAGTERLVPRYADSEFSPEREIAALALLAGCEVPTPSLVAADPAGAYCDAPALLITRLVGHPPRPAPDDLPEYLIQLAAALLAIHARGGASTMPPYVPYNRLDQRRPPRHALRPQLWERAFEVAAGPAPEAPYRFIHRDYHPDNTLWSYGRLTGIVDWSDASYGPVAVDIAHMRLNLALRYGPPAAERFVAAFDQVSGGYRHHPYWDVRCLLDLLPEDGGRIIDEAKMPLVEDYLAGLLAELSG